MKYPLVSLLCTPFFLLSLGACSVLEGPSEGEEGNLQFEYFPGQDCGLGCGLSDDVALAGAVVRVDVTDPEGEYGTLKVRSADESRGKVLAQTQSARCSNADPDVEVDVGGTCSDGEPATTVLVVEVETTAQDVELIVDDGSGELVDRATVRVRRAARLEVTAGKYALLGAGEPATRFAVGDEIDFAERLFDGDDTPLQHQRRTVTRTVEPPGLLVPAANPRWADDPEWEVKAPGTVVITSTALGGATTTTTLTLQ